MTKETIFNFTPKSLNALKCEIGKKDYSDTQVKGLRIRIRASGKKTFVYTYRFNGKQRQKTYGDYPALTLAEARAMLIKDKTLLNDGTDPQALKDKAKNSIPDFFTVGAGIDLYIKNHVLENWKIRFLII